MKCSNCGNELKDYETVCPICSNYNRDNIPFSKKQKKTKKKNIVVFLIVLLLLGVFTKLAIDYNYNSYTVSFISNSKEVYSKKVNKNSTISYYEPEEKEGYIFVGWYYNGEPFDFNNKITSNIKLEAVYRVNSDEEYYTDNDVIDDGSQDTNEAPVIEIPKEDEKHSTDENEPIEETGDNNDKVKPQSIAFNKKIVYIDLDKGNKTKLLASVQPTDAYNRNIIWTSSDPTKINIKDGYVTSDVDGVYTLTASSQVDDKVSSTISVFVGKARIIYNKTYPSKISINVDNSIQLSANMSTTSLNKNASYEWYSSNSKIATIDKTGKVVGKASGTTTITLKDKTSGCTKTVIIDVKAKNVTTTTTTKPVNPVINPTSITLDVASASLIVGNTKQLIATILPANATNKNITWSSSNANVATVSNSGLVTAKNAGTATITAKTSNGKTATCKITVAIKNVITVYFHRNAYAGDQGVVSQTFTLGDSGNRFGYNTNEKPRWIQTGDFGQWKKDQYMLMGWSLDSNAQSRTWTVYSNVTDTWIQKVLDLKYSPYQTVAGEIHLYGVWQKSVDLVLFFGQSNMVGTMKDIEEKDTRSLAGVVDQEIIDNYSSYNHVNVDIKPGTAYEYQALGKGLVEINSKTRYLGQYLEYKDGELVEYNYYLYKNSYFSATRSHGTNMIPQYAKTYYELTGHTLVAVMSAVGAQNIASFLPTTDPLYDNIKSDNPIPHSNFLYEALVLKYKQAEQELIKQGYVIRNKYYVVYQGCADTRKGYRENDIYYDTFFEVHGYLKKDLGLTFGAMVEVGGNLSPKANSDNAFIMIHEQQEKLIKEKDEIILGSDLPWRAYKSVKDNKSGNYVNIFDGANDNNYIHLTSAGLSQVGKEAAINVKNSGLLK